MNYFQPRPPERCPDGFRFGLVTFVDILGFSAASKELPREAIQALLMSRRTVSRSALSFIGAPTLPREFIMFQDSMVRCTEIGYMNDHLSEAEEAHHLGNWVWALMDEIASLREIQLGFIARGFLLRGAIAVGEYDTADGSAWGSGYERAASLEATVAVHPRIVLDEHLQGFLEYVKKVDLTWLLENVRTDQDGVSYLDYLRGIAFECPNDLSAFASQLIVHRDYIRRALATSSDPDALSKVGWLAAYHNTAVSELALRRPQSLEWNSYACSPSS